MRKILMLVFVFLQFDLNGQKLPDNFTHLHK